MSKVAASEVLVAVAVLGLGALRGQTHEAIVHRQITLNAAASVVELTENYRQCESAPVDEAVQNNRNENVETMSPPAHPICNTKGLSPLLIVTIIGPPPSLHAFNQADPTQDQPEDDTE
jgi:hypothetical protein